jgi:hypothetical protein
MISKGMVDEVQYNQAGNQVTLVKRFGGCGDGACRPVDPGPDGAAGLAGGCGPDRTPPAG